MSIILFIVIRPILSYPSSFLLSILKKTIDQLAQNLKNLQNIPLGGTNTEKQRQQRADYISFALSTLQYVARILSEYFKNEAFK